VTLRNIVFAALALAAAPVPAQAQPAAPRPVDYRSDSSWLCLPGRADSCSRPLPTTALNANGYGSEGEARPAANPKADCFYVYPTVSADAGFNSDLEAGREESWMATVQLARFGSVCRTFAPIYRQATVAALLAELGGRSGGAEAMALAYRDVRDSWRNFIEHRNQGRPFVLIGHSQGTIHLTRLLAEIENSPVRDRMLSALLIGFNVEVPEGELVGGSFRRTPLCSRVGETGCVVTYVSFRASAPPVAGGMFGAATRPGMTIGCTNPARLRRGSAPLDSYWPTGVGLGGGPDPIRWSAEGAPPSLFVRTEGLVTAACVNRGPLGYLSVIVNGDPADPRTDEIPGDLRIAGRLLRPWGLHVADMQLAQGDLIALVEEQAEAVARRR
jgi:hypothetical protein